MSHCAKPIIAQDGIAPNGVASDPVLTPCDEQKLLVPEQILLLASFFELLSDWEERCNLTSVEIMVDLALVQAKPPLKAVADITLRFSGELIKIKRCAVFQKPGEPPWATLPRLSVERQGKSVFVPIVELSRSLKERVLAALINEYHRQTGVKDSLSSPGVSDPAARATSEGPDDSRQRTARDARGPSAGAGSKGPTEKLRARRPPKAVS